MFFLHSRVKSGVASTQYPWNKNILPDNYLVKEMEALRKKIQKT